MAKASQKKPAKGDGPKTPPAAPTPQPAAVAASPFAAAAASHAAKKAAENATTTKKPAKPRRKPKKKPAKKKPAKRAPRKTETPKQRTARLKKLEGRKQRRAELAVIAAEAQEDAKRRTKEQAEKVTVLKVRRGPKGFKPTEEQRAQVQTLAGLGIRHDEICILIINPKTGAPLDDKTLRTHFAQELAAGPVRANAAVAGSLYKRATASKGGQAVTAAIWWTKCQMGWKERVSIEVEVRSGVLVPPAKVTPEDWIEAAQLKAAATLPPGGNNGSD